MRPPSLALPAKTEPATAVASSSGTKGKARADPLAASSVSASVNAVASSSKARAKGQGKAADRTVSDMGTFTVGPLTVQDGVGAMMDKMLGQAASSSNNNTRALQLNTIAVVAWVDIARQLKREADTNKEKLELLKKWVHVASNYCTDVIKLRPYRRYAQ